jgi:hypothetical protein
MLWQDVKQQILDACGPLLESQGFKFVKSRSTFQKPTPSGRMIVRFLFTASDVGNYSVAVGCGVRHDIIERVVHQTSTIAKRVQGSTTTINAEWSDSMYLNTPEEQAVAAKALQTYIREVALPFLLRDYTLADFSALLNETDLKG